MSMQIVEKNSALVVEKITALFRGSYFHLVFFFSLKHMGSINSEFDFFFIFDCSMEIYLGCFCLSPECHNITIRCQRLRLHWGSCLTNFWVRGGQHVNTGWMGFIFNNGLVLIFFRFIFSVLKNFWVCI
ncbi:hypothetical protein CsatA_002966 [Cannabis sativa]